MTFDQFKSYAREGNVIPVYSTFMADLLTPVSAFLRLQQHSSRAFLLESVEGGEKTARFSFLGVDPFLTVHFDDHELKVETQGQIQTIAGDIFHYLNDLFSRYKPVRPSGLPRFTGGAVGYFGYETIRYIEDIPIQVDRKPDLPEAVVMLFDTVLAFDHLRHQIYVIKNVFLREDAGADLRKIYDDAMEHIAVVADQLEKEIKAAGEPTPPLSEIVSNVDKPQFCEMVRRAQEYISAGDAFQVVLSQRFEQDISVRPFDIYRALRVINPSPYLYFLQMDERCVIGSSPELLVRVEDGVVEVRPIAGTRPRGSDEDEDLRLQEDLLRDEKEIAEHVMLVDLGRNDVGQVSEAGSVDVSEFKIVEKYSHVMHLVSNVRGRLKAGLNALDALKACFPAGTVSGAPKIRAMQIISELERERRGVYAGALGYLDFSGNLDTCIAIRTIVTRDQTAYFQAGAGIVADSVPEREYQETIHKSAALRDAIAFAERGLK